MLAKTCKTANLKVVQMNLIDVVSYNWASILILFLAPCEVQ